MRDSERSDAGRPAWGARGSIRAEFDWSDVLPSTAVVEAVAIAANREPMELEPLYDTIDPDALDAIVRSGRRNSSNGTTAITFALEGHEVTVRGDGTVVVGLLEGGTNPA